MTDDPITAPGKTPGDRAASVLSNLAKVAAGVMILVDFFSKPPGVEASTLAAAAVLAAVANGIESSLAVILDRVLK